MTKLELNDDLVRRLSKLLEETGLSEIEYEAEGRRIRVARGGHVPLPQTPEPSPQRSPTGEKPAAGAATEVVAEAHPGAVVSPMVGTVYVAAEPGTPPLVKLGDRVKEGQTVIIVEAMKTMNPVPAPLGGKVTQILVENGGPVEFGEVLMIIE